MTITVVDRYTLAPGCCLVCHQPRLPAVSTGIDIHQPGQLADSEVVICGTCILHMAREVGTKMGHLVVAQTYFDELHGSVGDLEASVEALTGELSAAYAARDAVLASVAVQRPAVEQQQVDEAAARSERERAIAAATQGVPDVPPPKAAPVKGRTL